MTEAEQSEPADQSGEAATASEATADRFAVVGLGASAGGLEALLSFFENMPSNSGAAFVVVTHQHPGHVSMLPELIGRHCEMSIVTVSESMAVEPNTVYIAPASSNLLMRDGVLQLSPVDSPAARQHPIDIFFRSLAKDMRERAIGVVLSGTGTDGTLGLKEIKGASGMVMVQEEASALYRGMPASAITTGLVDYVLPAGDLPAKLVSFLDAAHGRPAGPVPSAEEPETVMQRIFSILRRRLSYDFSSYKIGTVQRRIERRMNVHHLHSVDEYVALLGSRPGEVDLLFKELLIGVTSFFRDREAFDALARVAIPELLLDRPEFHTIRVWVPGCSTGEEAYSIAILLHESMERLGRRFNVQIFATDIDPDAVEVARAGVYPDSIATDVIPERLGRYFTQQDRTYAIRKDIRESIVFAPQNVIADPPFSRLDLLSCRNLLIYFKPELQKKLLPIFHYSLRPGGILFLGSAETVGEFDDLFAPLDKKWKIYRRLEVARRAYYAAFPLAPATRRDGRPGPQRDVERHFERAQGRDLERLLLDQVPPSALVDAEGHVLHLHGRTGRFLEPAPGAQERPMLLAMARDGLRAQLAMALRRARARRDEVVVRVPQVQTNNGPVTFDLRVRRIDGPPQYAGMLLVSFAEVRPGAKPGGANRESERVEDLERALRDAQETDRSTLEALETTNEELKSANEELRSINEEQETSREEMESLNEELSTVNAELRDKVEELSRAQDDLQNVLRGADIATLFLDRDLRIKSYSARLSSIFGVIPSDVGRPLADLASKLRYERMVADAADVLGSLTPKQLEVTGRDGHHYLMRILPYRTAKNVIEGVGITLVDITGFERGRAGEDQG